MKTLRALRSLAFFACLAAVPSFVSVPSFASGTLSTYSQMESYVDTHPEASLNDFIAQLDPAVLASYAVVYRSRAFLGTDPLADDFSIVIGNSNRDVKKPEALFLAFKIKSGTTNGEAVDVIHLNPESRRNEYRQFLFPDANASVTRATVSGRAGETAFCLSCHGSNGNVAWDAQPAWPGMIGSHDPAYFPKTPAFENRFISRIKSLAQDSTFRYRFLPGIRDYDDAKAVAANQNMGSLTNFANLANATALFKEALNDACKNATHPESIAILRQLQADLNLYLDHGSEKDFERTFMKRNSRYAEDLKDAESSATRFSEEVLMRLNGDIVGLGDKNEEQYTQDAFRSIYLKPSFGNPALHAAVYPLITILEKAQLQTDALQLTSPSNGLVFSTGNNELTITSLKALAQELRDQLSQCKAIQKNGWLHRLFEKKSD